MNQRIQSQLSGGQVYNTVYAASFSQISTLGTIDIVNQITNTLRTDPGHCFILEGYSQGASATVEALKRLSGAQADAVKGVFLIGNPQHKAGLACNVDANGGTTTRNVNGLSVYLGGVPATWVPKTLDVCNFVSIVINDNQADTRVMAFVTRCTELGLMHNTWSTVTAARSRTKELLSL